MIRQLPLRPASLGAEHTETVLHVGTVNAACLIVNDNCQYIKETLQC
jgi:hypothetical protein